MDADNEGIPLIVRSASAKSNSINEPVLVGKERFAFLKGLMRLFTMRGLKRECFAEFFGTFILILFGVGVVAQVVLSGHNDGSFLSVNFGWGFGITFGILASGGSSGGHLNPAVTLAFAIHGRCQWRKVPFYIIAQFLGAILASCIVYGVYYDALNHFDGGVRQVTGPQGTAGIWATYPQPFLSIGNGFGDQVVGTALLVAGIFAATDPHNVPSTQGPWLIGSLMIGIGACYGYNAGYAINPARDLGPRLFTWWAGWGNEVFIAGNHWWWVPVVAPMIGGVLGSCMYQFLVGMHRE